MSLKKFFSDLPWLGNSLVFLLSFIAGLLAIAAIYTSHLLTNSTPYVLWGGVILTGLLLLLVIGIRLAYSLDWVGKPIVLKPIRQSGTVVGIIFIQGEGIPIERYIPIAQTIQATASNLGIWVGIPRFMGDSPIPRETGLAVTRAIREMKRQGMPPTDNLFFIAHSVGGIAIQKYLKSFPNDAKGQILMGSFLGKWYFSNSDLGKTTIQYPVPTLTIGGTLDGLARITRIAVSFWHQQINSFPATDAKKFPVAVINGASHMQFASGEATSYVADFDLKPTLTEEEVHQQVSELVYHFICAKIATPDSERSSDFLSERQQKTQYLLQPLLDAFLLEGYNGFKPACYNRAEDNTRTDPTCTPYSPWIQENANPIMAGSEVSPVPFNLTVIDSFHRSYTIDPFHNPHVHIPQIRNTCMMGSGPCNLTISSVTQALYNWLEFFDTGFFPISAFSLRTKLNSRQNIWKQAGVPNPIYEETDGPSRGAEINQQVYQWALENAGVEVRSYFEEFGTPVEMGEDVAPIVAAGPLWIWNYPKYGYIFLNKDEPLYQVRSVVMKTPINYPIPSASGVHYCQLLSPAAAMEWIYIDGLRLKASLSGNPFTYGPLAGIDKVIRFFLRGTLRQTRTKGLLKRV